MQIAPKLSEAWKNAYNFSHITFEFRYMCEIIWIFIDIKMY